jgi:hypothetical protein
MELAVLFHPIDDALNHDFFDMVARVNDRKA